MVHPLADSYTGKLIFDDELDHRRRKVGREGKTRRRQKTHDEWRLLLNLPSDYVEEKAADVGRRRRPSLTTASNRNFNELWIKQQLSTTPA